MEERYQDDSTQFLFMMYRLHKELGVSPSSFHFHNIQSKQNKHCVVRFAQLTADARTPFHATFSPIISPLFGLVFRMSIAK